MRHPAGVLAIAFLSVAAFADGIRAAGSSGEVPFTNADGLIWVDVVVPGHSAPLNFVLDTGAGATVLDLETALELGFELGAAVTVEGIQGPARTRWVEGFDGRLAGTPLPKKVIALDLGGISRSCHRRINGLIGADFLEGRVVQIDFAARRVRIGSACKEAGDSAIEVRLKRINDAWCVPVRVNGGGRNQWVRLDSGCDQGLAWWPGRNDRAKGGGLRTLGLAVGRADETNVELHFGDATIRDVSAKLLSRQLFPSECGLVGNRVLSRFRVTLDVPRKRVILEPRAATCEKPAL